MKRTLQDGCFCWFSPTLVLFITNKTEAYFWRKHGCLRSCFDFLFYTSTYYLRMPNVLQIHCSYILCWHANSSTGNFQYFAFPLNGFSFAARACYKIPRATNKMSSMSSNTLPLECLDHRLILDSPMYSDIEIQEFVQRHTIHHFDWICSLISTRLLATKSYFI